MTIDVLFTGGTIGCTLKENTLSPEDQCGSLLIRKCKTEYPELCEGVTFRESYPLNLLSENMQKQDLLTLITTVRKMMDHSEGIIITHGTDTLSDTANLLSLFLAGSRVPIVLVSSLYPLTDSRNNGVVNFAAAVRFLTRSAVLPGVFVSFLDRTSDPLGAGLPMPACRIRRPDDYSGIFTIYGADRPRPTVDELTADRPRPTADKPTAGNPFTGIDDRILVLQARSLLRFDLYSFTEKNKPHAVVVELYHSGTVCTVGDKTNLLSFAEYCKNLDIPVILSPVLRLNTLYASATGLGKSCILSYDQSFEMTVAKVMAALGSGLDLQTVLDTDYCGEHLLMPF